MGTPAFFEIVITAALIIVFLAAVISEKRKK